ncbi:hydrogenase iron-sulfur subunit [bacterium]|nr:hydrogenase iron-sulfur subunit [candidate division CSSED10-310 bacterium]
MKHKKLLVVGGGLSGLTVARIAMAHQLKTVIIEKSSRLGGALFHNSPYEKELHESIQIIMSSGTTVHMESRPLHVRGCYPEFNVEYEQNGKSCSDVFSDIVFAAGVDLTVPDWLNSMGRMKNAFMIFEPNLPVKLIQSVPAGSRLCFVTGYSHNSSPFAFRLAMEMACELAENKCRIFMIQNTIRFSDPLVTELYRRCRESGIVFIKSDLPPDINFSNDEMLFRVADRSLGSAGSEAKLQSTIHGLVFEPGYIPRIFPELFWSPHRLRHGAGDFPGFANNRFLPMFSNRKGIYFAGSITGIRDPMTYPDEAMMILDAVLTDETVKNVPVVDEDKCAVCLTCARVCPHGAVTIDTVSNINKEACDGCGICIAECPASAIQWKSEENDFRQEVRNKMKVYCCEGSTRLLVDRFIADAKTPELPFDLQVLPCSGNIQIVELLTDVNKGYKRILVCTCHDENCLHLMGNQHAGKRVRYVNQMISSLGITDVSIQVKPFAAHMLHAFKQYLRENQIPDDE